MMTRGPGCMVSESAGGGEEVDGCTRNGMSWARVQRTYCMLLYDLPLGVHPLRSVLNMMCIRCDGLIYYRSCANLLVSGILIAGLDCSGQADTPIHSKPESVPRNKATVSSTSVPLSGIHRPCTGFRRTQFSDGGPAVLRAKPPTKSHGLFRA